MLFERVSSILLANSRLWGQGIQASISAIIPQAADKEFIWDNISAHKQLVYHDCYGDYKCARLEVPMDWTVDESMDNRTVQIAIIKLPATVPITDPRYGGVVALNPGGPGGSGVKLLLKEGKQYQTIISAGPDTTSDPTSKHFDIISFDPRGVKNTRPSFSCFPDYIERHSYELENQASGVFGSNDMAFNNHWTRVRTVADTCSKRAIELGIGEHMGTASVARDVLEIFERHGEWREQEARKLLQPALGKRGVLQQHPIAPTLKHKPGEEKIQYWGFSYGTVLGVTLASMYPKLMHRMILDGVVDSHDYYLGNWTSNLHDTDLEVGRFGHYCHQGGPQNCALYLSQGANAIVERFVNITETLKRNPVGVEASYDHAADLATFSDLKRVFKVGAYNPLTTFHDMAEVMYQVEKGNGTALVEQRRKIKMEMKKGLSKECLTQGPYSLACGGGSEDFPDPSIPEAIWCSDAEDQTGVGREEFWGYVQDCMRQSWLIGDVWAEIRLPCTSWHAKALWKYKGGFNATTAHPILFIGNTVDNVTPIRNAFKMSKGFEGSVVLRQDSEGHCSSSGVSFCTSKTIRRYFQTGKLPEKGRVCKVDRVPLDGFSEEERPELPRGETDEELWRAMVGLNK